MDDRNVEQQVWQRVRSASETAPRNDLRQLQREAIELAGVYRSLIPRMTGTPPELLKKLHQGEQANAAALAGIGVLSRHSGEHLKLWQPGKDEPKKLLEHCYHRTRRCAAEYLARSADAEFGLVFDRLAKREAEHCCMIAQILGSLR